MGRERYIKLTPIERGKSSCITSDRAFRLRKVIRGKERHNMINDKGSSSPRKHKKP